jgi:plastocyanin
MRNPSAVPHNIAVKGRGIYEQGPVVSNGRESHVTLDLKPGAYEFFCSVDAHEAAGMKGRLVVAARNS